ncbi:hypothetical protein XENTR_v10012041 [Xenopus tropicalis]|uniref:Nardilysin n=1 Tax=Xenopus tropicalis TaxID=8364 RepID=F7AJT5_XENTR|nr:nardilysin [Xenopus tropicalis]KAE8610184.1 hypothetical protein XENTR_v10012041 [Xenopus tropicalis]KAE8610185.1 hypothetical protein XENTR_v10012041 [Xenopus tropicalis]
MSNRDLQESDGTCPALRKDSFSDEDETSSIDGMEDPDIVKSPNDPKKYRYIQLDNGLRVLLVCDLTAGEIISEYSEDEIEEDDEQGQEQEQEQEDECASDSQASESSGVDSGNKQGCEEKLSAAALCVGIGSFSDPEELLGMAHFLEHMVFMGSEKFPDENGFEVFLKKYGGSTNASTDAERTIFQFDVQRKHFKQGLDRWAQFFTVPLLIRDAVEREVEAVDSEFQIGRPNDTNRRQMLFASLAKPGHPMAKFSWGNAQTLKNDPKEKNIDPHSRLRKFYERQYSANYMTLAVQSKETLATLEAWVKEIFSNIPNNGLPKPDYSNLTEPFNTPDFNLLYRVVPIKKDHTLTISWAMPPQQQYYRVKPLRYFSWLIGHEGKGSILSLLRKKFWAVSLYGGSSPLGAEQNSTCTVFTINITLTDAGYEHFYEVLHIVFQYVKMMQVLGPQERIFREIQQVEANGFRFQEQTESIKNVEDICEHMQLYAKADILTGEELLFEYKPEIITNALKYFTPLKANLMLLSPNNEGKCDLVEKYFGTQYSKEDIDPKWKALWATDFPLIPELHLPEENKFIASDFTLKTSDCPNTEYPVKVLDTELGSLWYKKDNKFKIPKAYVRFHLISPEIQKSPENLVLFDIFINILTHTLAESAYEADLAQLEYKVEAGEHGLIIGVKGFNHKLPLLFELIIDHLADFTASTDEFEMITEQLKKIYFNQLIKQTKLGPDIRLIILEHGRWSMMQKYETMLKGVTLKRMLSFVKAFKSRLYAEGLVQGNFTCKESVEFLNYVVKKLKFSHLESRIPVEFQVVELPSAHHLCKVKALNKEDANSQVTVYYQSGARNLREYTMMELLVLHMEEPSFDFLRTKQTLGYQVYPTCRNTSGILGFSITVESQATKYNSEFVDQKIEEFLVLFADKIAELTDEEFKIQVKALIKKKECEDTNLGEEVDRNWNEVVTQQYLFERLTREISALKTFAKEDMISWFKAHRGSDRKVLSVHAVGFGEKEPDAATCYPAGQPDSSSSLCLSFLPATPLMASAVLITDIPAFTAPLKLFPYHKVIN